MSKKWTWGQRNKPLTDDRWDLVINNMHLIDIVINYYSKRFPIIQKDVEEYKEAATEGLIHSARKFDFNRKEAEFSTYALTAMKRDVMRVINFNKKYNSRFKSREAFQNMLNGQGIECSQENLLISEQNILEDIINKEDIFNIRMIIKNAPKKEKQVIKMRFFENKTYQEISEFFGVTKEMARIYCKQAVKYISNHINNKEKVLMKERL